MSAKVPPLSQHRLDEEFFARLEEAGEIDLNDDDRRYVTELLSSVPAAPQLKISLSARRAIIADAERLRASLVASDTAQHTTLGHIERELIPLLEEFVVLSNKHLVCRQRKGRPRKNDRYVRVGADLTEIYEWRGRKVVFNKKDGENYNGPVSRFLSVIWSALPVHSRPPSSQTWIDYVKKEVIDRRLHGGRCPMPCTRLRIGDSCTCVHQKKPSSRARKTTSRAPRAPC